MHLLTTAWDDVSAESINANCWQGLEDVFPAPVNGSNSAFDRFHKTDLNKGWENRSQDNDGFNDPNMLTAQRGLGYVTSEELTTWLTIENELTSALPTDQEIVESV